MQAYAKVAVVAADAKFAALFFDKVCPHTSAKKVPADIRLSAPIDADVADKKFQKNLEFTLTQTTDPDETLCLIDNLNTLDSLNAFADAGIYAVPLFRESHIFQSFISPGKENAIEVCISEIPIVDERNLTWEQVVEVRSDLESQKKLRKFRLFLANNYHGKSSEYVKDSLLTLLDDYESACKKHGLELILSTISNVLNSKSLIASLSVSAAGLLLGEPTVAATSVLAGSVIEIGKAFIQIAEKKIAFRSKQTSNEIAYLVTLRDKMG